MLSTAPNGSLIGAANWSSCSYPAAAGSIDSGAQLQRPARALDRFLYTVYRLGAFGIRVFLVDPLTAKVTELLHLQGIKPFNLETCCPA